jgi:hypothetical protein
MVLVKPPWERIHPYVFEVLIPQDHRIYNRAVNTVTDDYKRLVTSLHRWILASPSFVWEDTRNVVQCILHDGRKTCVGKSPSRLEFCAKNGGGGWAARDA